MFSNNLSWATQYDVARKKIISMSGFIHHFIHVLNMDCQKKIVQAFVQPQVRYCLPVWDNSQTRQQTKIDASLLRTVRIVLQNTHTEFSRDTYALPGILSFKSVLFLSNVCCIFNFVHSDATPYYVNTLFNLQLCRTRHQKRFIT